MRNHAIEKIKIGGGAIVKDFPDFMKAEANRVDSSQQNTKDNIVDHAHLPWIYETFMASAGRKKCSDSYEIYENA